jgi:DNA-binding MarR family transcriptional regulator
MTIEEELRQKHFVSPYNKATVNLLMTDSWLVEYYVPIFKSFGITKEQSTVLKILFYASTSRVNINYIIVRMLDKNSNVSRLVDKLESKNLVSRKTAESDKRVAEIRITPEGTLLYLSIEKAMAGIEKKLNNFTDEEIIKLNNLLDKLRNKNTTIY